MNAESQSNDALVRAATEKLSWLRALMISAGVIYLPLLVMCLYTAAFVSCSHCKRGVWIVAPLAPGGFIWEWTRHFIGLPRASGVVVATVSGVLSALIVAGLAAGLRGAAQRRWRIALLGTTFAAATFLAYAVLGLMRA